MTMPMRPRTDGYGNPLPDPTWKGYTLDDLLTYAQGGPPVSSVAEGQVGYGLDQVGDASYESPTGGKKPLDWKRVVGAALAGLATAQPGAGIANLGRGFVGGTSYLDNREQEQRRNALTESQIQYQQGRNDLNQLEILDYPTKRAQEDAKWQAGQDYTAEQIRSIGSQVSGRADLLPSQIAENEAQARAADALARQRNRLGNTGRGAIPSVRNLGAVERQIDDTRTEMGQLKMPTRPDIAAQAMNPSLLPQYHADSADVGRRLLGLQTRMDSLGPVRDSLAAGVQGRPFHRPPPVAGGPLTAAPIYARPPAASLAPDGVAKTRVSQEEYDALLQDNDAAVVAAYYEVEK